MRKIIITLFLLAIMAVGYWAFGPQIKEKIDISETPADPINITYSIDGKSVNLKDGVFEESISSSSSSKTVTTVFGKPNYGDLNADGINDAVTVVSQSSGGSGTFYYAVVAIGEEDGFRGLSGVFLGDRIAPQSVLIKDAVAMVNYADRAQGEPMSTQPSVGVTKYIVVEDGKVKQYNLLGFGEQMFTGNLIMSHEVRVFTPCGGTAHWVIGTSTAYSELTKAYNAYKATSTTYSSVFVVVSGNIVSAPTDGFGKDYNYGIDIKNLLKVLPNKTCPKV